MFMFLQVVVDIKIGVGAHRRLSWSGLTRSYGGRVGFPANGSEAPQARAGDRNCPARPKDTRREVSNPAVAVAVSDHVIVAGVRRHQDRARADAKRVVVPV